MDSIQYLTQIESKGIKLGLKRTQELMTRCNNPHLGLPTIQVAGTNGKGSVCAMLANIFKVAGYKTGLFTSPHLFSLNERIRINNMPILNSEIDEFVKLNKKHIETTNATFFESITAMSFWFFKKNNVDIAIMETGLGGRLDSVSICEPIATVITPISLDHIEILGTTLSKIAFEKAGIIKKGIPCIIAKQDKNAFNVILKQGQNLGAPIHLADSKLSKNMYINIPGNIQRENAQLAIATIEKINQFNIAKSDIITGLQTVNWLGRNQYLQKNPIVIFDVGHNVSGIKTFIEYFSTLTIIGQSTLVIALEARKNIISIIPLIEKIFTTIICTQTDGRSPMLAEELSKYFTTKNKLKIIINSKDAIKYGLDNIASNDALAIIGSHYLGPPINSIFNISFEKY